MTELKPCPFCGGEPELVPRSKAPEAFVSCRHCSQMTDTDEEAIRRWNQRRASVASEFYRWADDVLREASARAQYPQPRELIDSGFMAGVRQAVNKLKELSEPEAQAPTDDDDDIGGWCG